MQASNWSATPCRSQRETRCKTRCEGPAQGRERAAELRGVRDDGGHGASRCPTPSACWRRSPAAGLRGHGPRPAGLPRRRARRCASSSASCELVGGFVPVAFSGELRPRGPARDARSVRRRGRARRAAGAVRRRRAGADREPGRGRRRSRSTTRAGAGSSTASSARRTRRASAATSRSSTTTRRPTSRACRRSSASSRTPTCRCCSTPGTCSSPAATRCARSTDWRDRIGAVHIKDARLDVVAAVKAERADTLTAWRRGMFCALGEGDVDLVAFCAALRRLRRLGRRRAGPRARRPQRRLRRARRAEQVANREWLREHAGW